MQLKTILNFFQPHHGFVYFRAKWRNEQQARIEKGVEK